MDFLIKIERVIAISKVCLNTKEKISNMAQKGSRLPEDLSLQITPILGHRQNQTSQHGISRECWS